MLPEHFTFIDVETTGANLAHDRITEIGLLRIDHGQITARWQSLINPGQSIPQNIQALTGITDAMVENAPHFSVIANTIAAQLQGSVFVAHNARFDYGLITKEFALSGNHLDDMPVLCTVKLSRALYPAYHRHGLDILIERHGLHCTARHRAMGDAEALWQFFTLVGTQFPAEILHPAIEQAMTPSARSSGLPEEHLAGIPEHPGVYLFFTAAPPPDQPEALRFKAPLYIGSAKNLRSQITQHCLPSKQKGEARTLANRLRHVEWIETTGELETLLLTAHLKKKYPPQLPRTETHKRPAPTAFALRPLVYRRHPPLFSNIPLSGSDPRTWNDLYGIFNSEEEANSLLAEIARATPLCLCRLGLNRSSRKNTCKAPQDNQCEYGYPISENSLSTHDGRLLDALRIATAKMRWPWQGPVLLVERNEYTGQTVCHLFDHWCHLGSAATPEDVCLQFAHVPRIFDLEIYRILNRWLSQPAHRSAVICQDKTTSSRAPLTSSR